MIKEEYEILENEKNFTNYAKKKEEKELMDQKQKLSDKTEIILEIKTVDCFSNAHYNQCLNYLKVSGNELALLANFNSLSLEYKRVALSKK